MLEKPGIQEDQISDCLWNEYGLNAAQITFLPLGADVNTAVYRIDVNSDDNYFLKLRKGDFDKTSVELPKYLSNLGIRQIIPPLETKVGRQWGRLDKFIAILYPYVEGRNGYQTSLSEINWEELATALNKIHTAAIPQPIKRSIRRETFSPQYRNQVEAFMLQIDSEDFAEPVANELAVFLQSKEAIVLNLIARAEELAQVLKKWSFEFVMCHSDLHAGNIFISDEGDLFIVDWDEPILAPKERDLMYIGGALLASGLRPDEEENRFYPAYGDTIVDSQIIAYYRYERIIQDIAAFCEELLLSDDGGADREQSLIYLKSNFLPDSTIEAAYRVDNE